MDEPRDLHVVRKEAIEIVSDWLVLSEFHSLLIYCLNELDGPGLLIQGIHVFIIPRSAYLADLLSLVRWATMKIFCLSTNLVTISGKFLIIDKYETFECMSLVRVTPRSRVLLTR
jgi:hypothetical protein